MTNLNVSQPPKVEDANPFNEFMRDLTEKVALKPETTSVSTADAGGSYDATVQALINELKTKLNSLISELG